jgi:hypothetical protein
LDRGAKKNDLATKPISNAGFGPGPKVCVYLPSPQNLLDFAFAIKKLTKTKSFCLVRGQKFGTCPLRTTYSSGVVQHMTKHILKILILVSFVSFAQETDIAEEISIVGKIVSGVNQKPLNNGYVIIDMTGAISDENGKFQLIYKKTEKDSLKKIRLYGLGYKEFDTILNLTSNRQFNLNVVLEPTFDLNKEKAISDIKSGNIKIILSSGEAPIVYKTDKRFERKYNVSFSEYGCEAVAHESLYDYNTTVFEYLDKKYGTKWRNQIRKDVVGLEKNE